MMNILDILYQKSPSAARKLNVQILEISLEFSDKPEKILRELSLAYDESKHKRDKSGRWTGSESSNKELIDKHNKVKEPSTAIRIIGAPFAGSSYDTAIRKQHENLANDMLKNIVKHHQRIASSAATPMTEGMTDQDVVNIRKNNVDHDMMVSEMYQDINKYGHKKLKKKLDTYLAFHQAGFNTRQKAIKENSLHLLNPNLSNIDTNPSYLIKNK